MSHISRSSISPPPLIHVFPLHSLPPPLLCPRVPSAVQLIVKVLVSIMLKCVSLQQKPPSDMESTLREDYTADESEGGDVCVWVCVCVEKGITASECVVHLCSLLSVPPPLQPPKKQASSLCLLYHLLPAGIKKKLISQH